jgi:hypothetical protein
VLLSLHAVMGFAFGGVWTAGCGWAVGWGVTLLLKLLLVDAFKIPDDIAWRLMSGLGLRANKRKGSVKTRRKSAGWNTDYLLELLQIK